MKKSITMWIFKMRKLLWLFWFYWFSINHNIPLTYCPHSACGQSQDAPGLMMVTSDNESDNESDSDRWSVRYASLFTHQLLTKWPIMMTWFDCITFTFSQWNGMVVSQLLHFRETFDINSKYQIYLEEHLRSLQFLRASETKWKVSVEMLYSI